jgi:hypothetical protein
MSSPIFTPQIPNFLAIAQQAAEQRRQAEMDRLQQLQVQENRQNRAEQLGLQALQAGGKIKDVENAYGADAGPQTFARWRIYADAQKAKKQEADSRAAAEPLIKTATELNTKAPGTPEAANSLETLRSLLGDSADPYIQSIQQQTAYAPLLGALDQVEQQKKTEQYLAQKEQEARIQRESDLKLDMTKRGRDQQDAILAAQTNAAKSLYSNFYADLLTNGGSPEQVAKLREQILSDPAMGGKYAPVNLNIIEMEAVSSRRAAQPLIDIRKEILDRTGYTISPRVAKALVDGKAIEDSYTGIPMNVNTEQGKRTLGNINGALDALAAAKAAAIRVAAMNKGGIASEGSTINLIRKIGLGSSDADIAAYDSSKKLYGDMLTLALSGQQAAEQQIERLQGILPNFAELTFDKKTGGLSAASAQRIETAFRSVRNLVSGNAMIPPQKTEELYRKAFYSSVDKHLKRLNEAISPAKDPRFPKVERPR